MSALRGPGVVLTACLIKISSSPGSGGPVCARRHHVQTRHTLPKIFILKHIPHSGTRPLFLMVVHTLSAKRGPRFRQLYLCCLGKHSETETGFKTHFLPMKGENSIVSYYIVLMFKSVEIRWLFKEILVL